MPKPLKVLFVCLTQDAIATLSDALRNGGFEIQTQQLDEPKKLDAALAEPLDILLVDSLKSYPKLVEQIQTFLNEKSLDIPVLVYSYGGEEGAIVAAMKAGANDFISGNNPRRVLPAVKRELVAVQQRAALRKQSEVDALVQEIDGWTMQGWNVEPLAKKICERVTELFDLRLVWIGGKQVNGSVNVVGAAGCVEYLQSVNVRWDEGVLASGPVGLAIKKRQAVAMSVDAVEFLPWREEAVHFGARAILALPMVVRDEIIGVLVMYTVHLNQFDTATIKRYTAFANRLAINLAGAQEHQQFRLLSVAISKATQAIFIAKHDGTIIWFNQALSDISGYSSREIMDSTPHLFSSGSYEKSFWVEMWQAIMQGKVWSGDLLNRRKDGSIYSVWQSITPLRNEQGDIVHFLCVQQDVSEKKELERKIEYLAYHDVLTGLPNRSLLNDRMQQAISQAKRDQTEFSLLFIDLDGFKEVNDVQGHAAGDLLLKIVAERLRTCVREGDTVARLGGDEFMVLLRDVSDDEGVKHVAHKILDHIAQPCDLDGQQASVTASIGISCYPGDGVSVEKLMNAADEAMYTAKRDGKNGYAFWHRPAQRPKILDWQI